MLKYEVLTIVQAIPYSTFKERIRFIKNNLKYVDNISFDKDFIYIEKRIRN